MYFGCVWLLFGGGDFLQTRVPPAYTGVVFVGDIIGKVSIAGLFVMYVFAVPFILYAVILIGSDLIVWLKWARSEHKSITASEFLQILGQYENINPVIPFGHWFIRAVREQGLLTTGPDTELLLQQLALTLEQDIKSMKARAKSRGRLLVNLQISELVREMRADRIAMKKRKKGLSDPESDRTTLPSSTADFERWYFNYTRKNRYRLAGWGPELLDDISQMREQARATSEQRPMAG
jgi:hypothetical protein